tara:strand:- start:1171 stop:2100 length:930 start_codon:yes stop_codon:yes gene_type:complete
MFKILLFLLCFLSPFYSYGQKIVVLSSVSNFGQDEVDDIEHWFKRSFEKSGYDLHIEHEVSASRLEFFLTSDETFALFYISHSSGGTIQNGVSYSNELVNIDGIDVAPVFQRGNPNLKFLAIVGCSSSEIVKKIEDAHEGVKIFGTDGLTPLNWGIKDAIKSGAELYDSSPKTLFVSRHKGKRIKRRYQVSYVPEFMEPANRMREKPQADGFHIQVYNPTGAQAILTINQSFVGVLKDSTGEQEFFIPHDSFRYGKYKLIATFSHKDLEKVSPLKITHPDKLSLSFKVPSPGQINGGKKSFYYFKNSHL